MTTSRNNSNQQPQGNGTGTALAVAQEQYAMSDEQMVIAKRLKTWGKSNLPQEARLQMSHIAAEYGLDPFLNHLEYLGGKIYPTVAGMKHLAANSGRPYTMQVLPADDNERKLFQCDDDEFLIRCEIHIEGIAHPFVEWSSASPKDVSKMLSKHKKDIRAMAMTRAQGRALRAAFGIGLTVREEISYDNEPIQTTNYEVVEQPVQQPVGQAPPQQVEDDIPAFEPPFQPENPPEPIQAPPQQEQAPIEGVDMGQPDLAPPEPTSEPENSTTFDPEQQKAAYAVVSGYIGKAKEVGTIDNKIIPWINGDPAVLQASKQAREIHAHFTEQIQAQLLKECKAKKDSLMQELLPKEKDGGLNFDIKL
jgi:hypothetical protein